MPGAPRLKGRDIKIAAPEAEQPLFERPTHFRRMTVRLNDPYTIHGSSFVRPPVEPILLDHPLKPNETFRWHAYTLTCLPTPGNSPAGLTFLLTVPTPSSSPLQATSPNSAVSPLAREPFPPSPTSSLRASVPSSLPKTIAFTGDLIQNGPTLHTWYDTEWDYGFAAGIHALQQSVQSLATTKPSLILPSHGPLIRDPDAQLTTYSTKLQTFEKLYLRGYGVEAASNAYQDKVSKPTMIKDLNQVSPHLFKFKRDNFWPNFNLILSDTGRGFVVDCGLLDPNFLDDSLEGLRKNFGLKAIDTVVITHMHGDHFLQAQHLRDKWGTKIWALDNMVEKMEHPERFDYAAPIQAYAPGLNGVKIDRAVKPGTTIDWEGYRFTIDWMPGQTEFALCLHGKIDNRLVAFTGDNIFGDPDDPTQTGHEAMVAHNSAILEEGYIYGSEFLTRLKPDILVGGHSFVMDHPAAFIERYRQWSYQMRDAFQSLSPDKDYRYCFDPFLLRAYPYRSTLHPGDTTTITLYLKNFRPTPQSHHLELHAPPGIEITPPILDGTLPPDSTQPFPIQIKIPPTAPTATNIIAIDTTLDSTRYGQRFDFLIAVTPNDPLQTEPRP